MTSCAVVSALLAKKLETSKVLGGAGQSRRGQGQLRLQGALNTSEVMLETKLGLTWPSWLTTGGTWLGPGSPADSS